ncbi:50S ribosomal protein L33 [Lentibacillus cibarius]|uniref:Large ribosomal subunit protein bL33 n=1 Tax=Lentibacillus cibarius TaxID=2583219 RepID=A0A5S3QKI8_9BACI|nr:50S ribosomal protein L33 [Lentibacillus cibarius]TMN22365.1 50S ribosomal protein L33 [Lentibacillus cibarius]
MKRKVALACAICSNRNYTTSKNASISKRLEMQKYCKTCDKHTLHRETK